MKFLSFIVPMYNVSKYIEDCLNSLVCQNIDKELYEIILVDDGSSDNTVEIAKKYQEKYSNIKLIEKENGGVSSARNRGIEESSGEYIWFVDSDDFIKANCLHMLMHFIRDRKIEFTLFEHSYVDENAKFVSSNCEDVKGRLVQGRYGNSTVCMTIIRADIIKENNIRFHENMKYGEDTLFQHYVYIFRKAETPTLYISTPLYFYRQRQGSSLNSKTKKDHTKHTLDYIEMATVYKKELDEKIVLDPIILKEIKQSWSLAVEGALTFLPNSNLPYKETIKDLKEKGLYPYPSTKWKMKEEKGIKRKLQRLVKVSFRNKFMYGIFYMLTKDRRKEK